LKTNSLFNNYIMIQTIDELWLSSPNITIIDIMNINIVWITCDICVFDIFGLDKDNINYNIYPLVVIVLHKNTTNTFSNTVSHNILYYVY
jgi:hypothetical protein